MKHRKSFKEKVYEAVRKIPKGRVLTYKKVAKRAGSPLAFRAVGSILNKNRGSFNCKAITRRGKATTSLEIPCHRVIRSNGEIGGYRKGNKAKIQILRKEGILIKHGKVASRFTK